MTRQNRRLLYHIGLYSRSLLFNLAFYIWTLTCTIAGIICGFLGHKPVMYTSLMWSYGMLFLCRWIIGVRVVVEGRENIPPHQPVLAACKHQSTWETAMIQWLVFDSSIILKKELMYIPLFGQALKAAGVIGIDRSSGKQAISLMTRDARLQVEKGRNIFIFPEGRRMAPGDKPDYKMGVKALYKALNIPVLPIALNSGYVWPRRRFLKYPGIIHVKILPPISPGLEGATFMQMLTHSIEGAIETIPKTDVRCLKG